jgi:hypothetical protein
MNEPKEEGVLKSNKKNYRQRTRKSAAPPKAIMSKPLPKEYVEQKKKEIPMYDPFTGDVNPYYEELTGKKNPLLEKNNDALSNTKNGVNHRVGTQKYGKHIVLPEFGRKNRFLLILPKELGIEPFFISSITGPKVTFDNIKVLGIKTHIKKYEIEDMILKFKSPLQNQINKKLWEMGVNGKRFGMKIEILEPNGVVYESWLMSGCLLKSVNFGTLDYVDSSISECELVISPSDYMIK